MMIHCVNMSFITTTGDAEHIYAVGLKNRNKTDN